MAPQRRDPLLVLGIAGGALAILVPIPLVLLHESTVRADVVVESRGLTFRTGTARALRLSNLAELFAVRVFDPADIATDLKCGHLQDYDHMRFGPKPGAKSPLDVRLSDLDLLPGDRVELRGAREQLTIRQERAGPTAAGKAVQTRCAPRAPNVSPVEHARASPPVECAFNLGPDPAAVDILTDPGAPCSIASVDTTSIGLRGAQCALEVVGPAASDAVSLLDGPVDLDCVDFGETRSESLAGVADYFRVSDVRKASVSYVGSGQTDFAVGPDVALDLEPANENDAARIVSLAVGADDLFVRITGSFSALRTLRLSTTNPQAPATLMVDYMPKLFERVTDSKAALFWWEAASFAITIVFGVFSMIPRKPE
jgi:hypothetical protein